MKQEKFKLTWQSHVDHIREMLHNMMTSNELTDITLVSEDKISFKVHKVVLSSFSPVFNSIINDNALASQTIFLRGIQSQEIDSILQFLYLGQATFSQERMNEIFNVAKSLEIKEINKNIVNSDDCQLHEKRTQEFYSEDKIPTQNIVNSEENIAKQEYVFENTSLLHEADEEKNPKFGKRTSIMNRQ